MAVCVNQANFVILSEVRDYRSLKSPLSIVCYGRSDFDGVSDLVVFNRTILR